MSNSTEKELRPIVDDTSKRAAQFRALAARRHFRTELICFSMGCHDKAKKVPGLLAGDKAIVPKDIKAKLTKNETTVLRIERLVLEGATSRAANGKESSFTYIYCGWHLELNASTNNFFLPYRMMQALGVAEGGRVAITSAVLPLPTFVRLRPHSAMFLEAIAMAKLKPKLLLERNFKHLTTMQRGATIVVRLPPGEDSSAAQKSDRLSYLLDVVELAPEPVVRLDEGRITFEIDFSPALESAITPRGRSARRRKERHRAFERAASQISPPSLPPPSLSARPSSVPPALPNNMKRCPSCQRLVPVHNFGIHSLRCGRNHAYHKVECGICGALVDLRLMKKHRAQHKAAVSIPGVADTFCPVTPDQTPPHLNIEPGMPRSYTASNTASRKLATAIAIGRKLESIHTSTSTQLRTVDHEVEDPT